MEQHANGANGIDVNTHQVKLEAASVNGVLSNGFIEPSVEELETELPVVYDGQVPLGDLLSRVVQAIYAELSELADTLPNMSDAARKRTLADWVVKTKKQIVKVYAITKWARDAETVQKCMNITAFLMTQNQQFEDVMRGLTYAKESLDPARLRNHDLLTSLDVLTTGTYRRLPTGIKKSIIPVSPLTDAEVQKTLSNIEDVIRFRLRLSEIVPIEMSRHHISHGQVHFVVPKLFEVSLCLRGAEQDDGWFFVHVKFLFKIGGDVTSVHDFPSEPTGMLKRHIGEEADTRMAYYLPFPEVEGMLPPENVPPRPQLPENTVDAPLVRLYNFLQIMSMSYQLEILWYQAERMRSLGWADYLKVEMKNSRKTLVVSYWARPPNSSTSQPQPPGASRFKLPDFGGTLTISIVENKNLQQGPGGPARSPKARILAEMQQRVKLGGAQPSDVIEGLKFDVRWEAMKGALGVSPPASSFQVGELVVDTDCLDFESLLRRVIDAHAKAILQTFQWQLQHGSTSTVFSAPGKIVQSSEGGNHSLRVHLCADEVVVVSIDTRTGRLNLRDTGDLAAASRGPRFAAISEKLNESPWLLLDALVRLRFSTISTLAEQKARYLGFQVYRTRNFGREEMQKLGPDARGTLFIPIIGSAEHHPINGTRESYLVIVITDGDFRFALVRSELQRETMYQSRIFTDVGWLNVQRIQGESYDPGNVLAAARVKPAESGGQESVENALISESIESAQGSFNLGTQLLRELYAYCCARVAYGKVEYQFKCRDIPWTSVHPGSNIPLTPELAHVQSSLARSVPALCVKASDILSGAPAAEAAMPNIRVIPLNWWTDKQAQVVTCVKLKYVQQPVGKRAIGSGGSAGTIRPSKRIIYDPQEAVVSFLSEQVEGCVDEFLEEWARVSKMVVIAREVARMSKEKQWPDVRLISFDLQTVEFAYSGDYSVSISATDQLSSTGGTYELRLSRCSPQSASKQLLGLPLSVQPRPQSNPHEDAEPFLRQILRQGPLALSVHTLVGVLRDTLPIAVELERMRLAADAKSSPSKARTQTKPEIAVETIVKGVGWYRVLYGDLRHALDFRLMTGQRIVILDASHSLFKPPNRPQEPMGPPQLPQATLGGLKPIPDFRAILTDALRSIRAHAQSGKFAAIDVGVVCDKSVVGPVACAIHERVLAKLKGKLT
ncbi:MED14-domain-containing protein [Coniophora puteana RWD-64-598 SS2]|uniref:Mediator of RNA polymerase II transcription subunit 14 n=1 Tax=Coniophora puteana (strain RWD-64-598) TaxID=741705 RepID=A0A5M3MII2_CONPW|nr:MED14-domain-containing protein [Coniophora puteana RWD-64-598 SS2]EIW78720.1 MED14-domain-containing protein [Coniophora puteana RWD-64-598 SS2]